MEFELDFGGRICLDTELVGNGHPREIEERNQVTGSSRHRAGLGAERALAASR